jgi:hypothetical protein
MNTGIVRYQFAYAVEADKPLVRQGVGTYRALSSDTGEISTVTLGVRVVASSDPVAPTNAAEIKRRTKKRKQVSRKQRLEP